MKVHHTPSHWILVAVVLLALLFVLREAHGQSVGAAAMFEGRPALAGAQGGLGAQAGPPQGGLGVQGPESAERSVHLRRPSGLPDANMPQGQAATSTDVANATEADPASKADAAKSRDHVTVKPHDSGIARDQRSAVSKSKRAVKRTLKRARTGTAEIDSSASPAR